ncbi:unnamed protein product [Effrenium voratum]|uniref:YHYH domain-containing protein n=1 Tax=Effrenium voratum TaxID=2562239 RepID=A0AA36IXG1_9DINO|nr:unnamed protein product [Effrenium voratum]
MAKLVVLLVLLLVKARATKLQKHFLSGKSCDRQAVAQDCGRGIWGIAMVQIQRGPPAAGGGAPPAGDGPGGEAPPAGDGPGGEAPPAGDGPGGEAPPAGDGSGEAPPAGDGSGEAPPAGDGPGGEAPPAGDGSGEAPPAGDGSGEAPPASSGGDSGGCNNPTCSSPPCAAPLLGDVGCSTVAGVESYNHGQVKRKGDSIPSDAHIFGPFEAGFGEQQKNNILGWGCTDPTVVYDNEGGKDLTIAEAAVAKACSIQQQGSNKFPRIEGESYIGIVGPCGGHTGDYHFHRGFGCLYEESGGHSSKVGVVAAYNLYGKWEDYANNLLPLLDACGAHFGPTPDSSGNVYHYHVQDKAPFTVGCYGPSASNQLVTVAECRALYPKCDNDGGAGTAIQTNEGTVTYDKFCPCWDAAGSNMGINLVELPALSTSDISYPAGAKTRSVREMQGMRNGMTPRKTIQSPEVNLESLSRSSSREVRIRVPFFCSLF